MPTLGQAVRWLSACAATYALRTLHRRLLVTMTNNSIANSNSDGSISSDTSTPAPTQTYKSMDELNDPTFTTPALTQISAKSVPYTKRVYQYIPHGGAAASSSALNTSHHWVIKTLIFTDRTTNSPLCVLMHGDCNVDTGKLGKQIGVKKISMCAEADAEAATGYQVGGTSPFGLKTSMPIYIQRSIVEGHADSDTCVRDADRTIPKTVLINGGARGLLIEMKPKDIADVLQPTYVDVAKLSKQAA